MLRIAASRGFSALTKNVIRSSHGHSTPSLKISCKSVQTFSRNLANKETKKDVNKEIDRKQYHVPRCIGDGFITNLHIPVVRPADLPGASGANTLKRKFQCVFRTRNYYPHRRRGYVFTSVCSSLSVCLSVR